MSRGRPKHHGSRRRAYSVRQREVRERRLRLAHDETDWAIDGLTAIDPEPQSEPDQPAWTMRLHGRATAA
ncbi:MAG: hypothetical protein ACRDFZ_05640 [Candidatus Limnocylindria bacterium]